MIVTYITESQNHRMLGVGRDLCGSSSPTPLLKKRLLQQAAQDDVQRGLEYFQRGRLHNYSVSAFVTLRGKKLFLISQNVSQFRWNFPCFSLCSWTLVLLLGTAEKSLAPFF